MGKIVSARAYANNEVAFLAWTLDAPIPGCLGFELTRIYLVTGEERVLPAWVAFKGQANPKWEPQTTSVWPVQKLAWRDLTARKRRNAVELRAADARVKYRIRPLVPAAPGLQAVPVDPNAPAYEGTPRPLAYADGGIETNEVTITAKYGPITSTFTNGILAAQWLKNAIEREGEKLTVETIRKHIGTPGDKIRGYLTGDVLGLLKALLDRAATVPGSKVYLGLYELGDRELVDTIIAHKSRIRLILSNSSKPRGQPDWDHGNAQARKVLHATKGLEIHDRMFNNSRIGHNKFAIFVDAQGDPKAVMTGSTNWTPTGLCGQSNNAVIIEDQAVAGDYLAYWQRMLDDTDAFTVPKPLSKSTTNVQSQVLRTAHMTTPMERTLADGTRVSIWCAPNTKATTKGKALPPDLSAVYSLMRKTKEVILFAVFLPSRSGKTSIVEEAIAIGTKDPSVLVYGAISDVTAMPNYVAPDTASGGDGPKPFVYEKGSVHVVRAAAIEQDDVIGDFERELLKAGNAIIHDKIVVIDPRSPDAVVVMGSHNLGYKASYENDENLVIIRGNPKLAEAYAVHVLDLYEHYRFRAVQGEIKQEGKEPWEGFLDVTDAWLDKWLEGTSGRNALARLFGS